MTEKQLPPLTLPMTGPLVVRHAAFAVRPAIYDELARILRERQFHHVFDTENGAMYLDQIALTRAPATLTAADIDARPAFAGQLTGALKTAWFIENGQTGAARRFITFKKGLAAWTKDIGDGCQFARESDAKTFIDGCSVGTWVAVEHTWG